MFFLVEFIPMAEGSCMTHQVYIRIARVLVLKCSGCLHFNNLQKVLVKEVIYMTDTISVGIDVSSKSNQVCLLAPDGKKLKNFSVQNNLSGAKTIICEALAALSLLNIVKVDFGMEATSVYGDNLLMHLKQDQSINSFDVQIFKINPKQVKKFKDVYLDLQKNDFVDAWAIAEYLRQGYFNSKPAYFDERFLSLQKLTRARYNVVQNLAREKNRYLNVLFTKFSEMAVRPVFSNQTGATAISVIEDFQTLDSLINIPLEELVEYIIKKGKNHFSDPEKVAKALQKAARSSYRLPKTIEDSVNQVLAITLVSINTYQKQLKEYDKAIENIIQTVPNTLTSIKGVGPVYSAGILAEIGDINRFNNHSALAKYAGIAWTQYQSGNYEASNTRMIKSGNRFLKYYLTEATYSAKKHDLELSRFFEKKLNEISKNQYKRALALTARKFVRIVFVLLRDKKLYVPPRI
jgi:transposase